jgi:hypothetical protein
MESRVELQERVRAMVLAGASLSVIEEVVIERAPLGPEDRDALWLYAWALESRGSGRLPRDGGGGRFGRLRGVAPVG